MRLVTIYEAGLGFWLHSWLRAYAIENLKEDAASIAVPQHKRRGKSDGIDGETLLRTLATWGAVRVRDGGAPERGGRRPATG